MIKQLKKIMDLIDLNPDILIKLSRQQYKYVVCTLWSESFKVGQGITTVLLTPIKEIIDGFRLLKSLHKESYLIELKEMEEDMNEPSLGENIRFLIQRNY